MHDEVCNMYLIKKKLTTLQEIWVQIWSSMYIRRNCYHFINLIKEHKMELDSFKHKMQYHQVNQ